ncbi:MAG: hypothetical protein JWO59_717 [Chloroflexi bacterium]|nr:hypothetical protein [Chloroflexota bacterium]
MTDILIAPATNEAPSHYPPYVIERVDHTRFTKRLNSFRISGSLRIVPEPSQSRGFRASGLSTCLRQTGYRLLGIKQTDDTYNQDNQLAADQGTAIHVRIQQQLVGAGMVLRHANYQHAERRDAALELSLDQTAQGEDRDRILRWNFTGHIDAVLEDNNGDLAIFDLKTGKPELLQEDYEYLPEKLQSYACQTTSYMAHFSAPDGRKALTTYVYMISRGETKIRALYRVPWQPERWAIDAARLDVATVLVQQGNLPPAEAGKDCKFCGWRSRCRKGLGE